MRSPLPAFQAFAHDARAKSTTSDALDERLSGFFAVTKAAERLSTIDRSQRGAYLELLATDILPPSEQRPTLRHDVYDRPSDVIALLTERFRVEVELMEQSGCFEMAFATMSAVCQLASRSDLATRMLSTVHLGRVARSLGDLDVATDCYQTAVDISLRERDGPLAARAMIGLGLVASSRGNRPAERSLFERALSLAHPGGTVEMAACQGLMMSALSERRLVDALLYGWRAFDLTAPASDERSMIVGNLATASLHGDFAAAALRGFLHVLTLTDTARIRLPNIGGAIRAAARLLEGERVEALNREGDKESVRAQMPFETARFLLYAGEAWTTIGDREFARRRFNDALAIANVHGFFELSMRAEAAIAELERNTPSRSAPNLTAESIRVVSESEAVVRDGIGRLEALGV